MQVRPSSETLRTREGAAYDSVAFSSRHAVVRARWPARQSAQVWVRLSSDGRDDEEAPVGMRGCGAEASGAALPCAEPRAAQVVTIPQT